MLIMNTMTTVAFHLLISISNHSNNNYNRILSIGRLKGFQEVCWIELLQLNFDWSTTIKPLLIKLTSETRGTIFISVHIPSTTHVSLSLSLVCRRTEIENKLAHEHCSEEKKKRQLQSLGRKESQYLRLRRTRLGLEDFVTVKVIGKGAFGEVSCVCVCL